MRTTGIWHFGKVIGVIALLGASLIVARGPTVSKALDNPPRKRILRNPKVCGGEPTIARTRVPVSSVVVQWRFYRDLDRLKEAFPHAGVDGLEAALRYCDRHRHEIDDLVDQSERAAYAAA